MFDSLEKCKKHGILFCCQCRYGNRNKKDEKVIDTSDYMESPMGQRIQEVTECGNHY